MQCRQAFNQLPKVDRRMAEYSEMSDQELALLRNRDSVPVNLEFRRRELEVQRNVAKAQIKAANWTRWSAVAVAISVIVTAVGIWVEWVQLGARL